MQCALDINRYFSHNCSGEGRIGKGQQWSGGREGIGKRAKRVNESKVTPGEGRRDSGHGTRGRHTPRLCLLCLQCSCCCCCCHFKLPIIDEFAKIQTDSEGQAGCGLQCSLSGSQRARRGGPAQKSLACSPACLPCPALCQFGFWAGHQRLHVRVRATHAPGLAPSRIMQIKWHISMSVAILLLQFSSLPSEAIN